MSDHTEVLQAASDVVYNRPGENGNPEDSFQTIADKWSAHLRELLRSSDIDGADSFELEAADVAAMMVDLKTSRAAGGHYNEDNWVDMAGYAENGARLQSDE
jgi:hypothetical protein